MDAESYEITIKALTEKVETLEKENKFKDALLDLLADNKIKTYRDKNGEVMYAITKEE